MSTRAGHLAREAAAPGGTGRRRGVVWFALMVGGWAAFFVLLAGTYTPFCLLLGGARGHFLLAFVWAGAALGVLQSIAWIHAPRAVVATLTVSLGWVVVPVLPALRA